MPRRKALRKNYSKKAIRRRSATKRQRLGRGLWFTRRAKIHPVLSVSRPIVSRRAQIHPVLSVSSPIVSPRLTESTPPDFEPFDPYENSLSNIPTHIGIIKQLAQELEKIYEDYPKLFNKIRDGYMKYATEDSVLSLYNDSYTREYENTIKSLIESLPDKQQYSEEEKDDTFNILSIIYSLSRKFLENITLDKLESSESFDEAEENIFKRFTDILENIIEHSNTRLLF
jgi:hypothetical protein